MEENEETECIIDGEETPVTFLRKVDVVICKEDNGSVVLNSEKNPKSDE